MGSAYSIYGQSRCGSAVSVLDFLTMGSSLSLRRFARIGSYLSVLDFLHVGSSLSVRAHARSAESLDFGTKHSHGLQFLEKS